MEEKYIREYKIDAGELLEKLKIDTKKFKLTNISKAWFKYEVTIIVEYQKQKEGEQ